MNRLVVNVATSPNGILDYRAKQSRLSEGLNKFGRCSCLFYTTEPPGSPKHEDVPYAFKAWALMARPSDLIAWMDSSIVVLRDMDPFWERIERDGYFIPANTGMFNYPWTAYSAYADLFPEMGVCDAIEANKAIPHCSSAVFGIDLRSAIGILILQEFDRLARTRAFIGPWANANGPDKGRYAEPCVARYTTAPCGPSGVRGHRHDQTALSVIAWRLGLRLTDPPDIYAHPNGFPEPPESVILWHQ